MDEFVKLSELLNVNDDLVHTKSLGNVEYRGKTFSIESFSIGPNDNTSPILCLIGGVHGLERIGAQVVLAYLDGLFTQLKWDKNLRKIFSRTRILAIPIYNPVGLAFQRRGNANGVDLNRNAPIDAEGKSLFFIGGQSWGSHLPFYRGNSEEGVEKENELFFKLAREKIFPSKASIALDLHSGFGLKDRIWYPFAYTNEKFPLEEEVLKIKHFFDNSFPNHVYKFEPQSFQYTCHGDIWDYLFLEKMKDIKYANDPFIPLTLEMGSWRWLKKNPIQLLKSGGLFHPFKEHRTARILRRHLYLIDFLLRITDNYSVWFSSEKSVNKD